MPEEIKQSESLSNEIQEIMRTLVSAIRAVKLYPPNNPVYSQSVKKSHEVLGHHLASSPDYVVGVQKTFFTYRHTPVGKDGQLNKAIAQDLFAKGIREIVFSSGVKETELMDLCKALALSSEELAMRNGLTSILWEKGTEHIKVTEAGLDEVITTKTEKPKEDKAGASETLAAKKKTTFSGRTLVLDGLVAEPAVFAASMLELAKLTKAPHETVEERLYALYQEAGRKIQEEHANSEAMFESLAKSVLSLESPYREALIAGQLYRDLDNELTEMSGDQKPGADQQFPSDLHEIQTGRFSESWTVKEVATLLKKSSSRKPTPSGPPSPADAEVIPLPKDLSGIAKELGEYTAEEMETLKILGESGMESDIIESAIRTLIHLIPLMKKSADARERAKEMTLFSGLVRQLEEMLSYILKKKDYVTATRIIRAFRMHVDPAFKPRLAEALKKMASKPVISVAIGDLRKHHKDTPEYQAAYDYLSNVERESTEVLLELMAEEKDRTARLFYLNLVKDIGKNQIELLGESLSDGRWYFVRNVVSILGESKTDQALAFLRKAADHNNVRIRQEVIKGLLAIGGKKAAAVLVKLLRDKDADVQVTAIHAFADLPGIGAEESAPLVSFLEGRPLRKKEQELTLEAIKALGKIGGRNAGEFLKGYMRIRWWKSRKLQRELSDAAGRSIDEIMRRTGDGRTA
jgi:hypothetical protein